MGLTYYKSSDSFFFLVDGIRKRSSFFIQFLIFYFTKKRLFSKKKKSIYFFSLIFSLLKDSSDLVDLKKIKVSGIRFDFLNNLSVGKNFFSSRSNYFAFLNATKTKSNENSWNLFNSFLFFENTLFFNKNLLKFSLNRKVNVLSNLSCFYFKQNLVYNKRFFFIKKKRLSTRRLYKLFLKFSLRKKKKLKLFFSPRYFSLKSIMVKCMLKKKKYLFFFKRKKLVLRKNKQFLFFNLDKFFKFFVFFFYGNSRVKSFTQNFFKTFFLQNLVGSQFSLFYKNECLRKKSFEKNFFDFIESQPRAFKDRLNLNSIMKRKFGKISLLVVEQIKKKSTRFFLFNFLKKKTIKKKVNKSVLNLDKKSNRLSTYSSIFDVFIKNEKETGLFFNSVLQTQDVMATKDSFFNFETQFFIRYFKQTNKKNLVLFYKLLLSKMLVFLNSLNYSFKKHILNLEDLLSLFGNVSTVGDLESFEFKEETKPVQDEDVLDTTFFNIINQIFYEEGFLFFYLRRVKNSNSVYNLTTKNSSVVKASSIYFVNYKNTAFNPASKKFYRFSNNAFNKSTLPLYFIYNTQSWILNKILVIALRPARNNAFLNINPLNNFSKHIFSKSVGYYLQILWDEEDEKTRKKKIYRKDRREYLNKVDFYFRSSEIFKNFLESENQKVSDGIFSTYEYLSIRLKNITVNRKNFNRFLSLKPYNTKFQRLLGFNREFRAFKDEFRFLKTEVTGYENNNKRVNPNSLTKHVMGKFLWQRGKTLYRYKKNLGVYNRKERTENSKIKISANALYNSLQYNFIKKFKEQLRLFSFELLPKETYGSLRSELQPIRKRKRIRKKSRFF